MEAAQAELADSRARAAADRAAHAGALVAAQAAQAEAEAQAAEAARGMAAVRGEAAAAVEAASLRFEAEAARQREEHGRRSALARALVAEKERALAATTAEVEDLRAEVTSTKPRRRHESPHRAHLRRPPPSPSRVRLLGCQVASGGHSERKIMEAASAQARREAEVKAAVAEREAALLRLHRDLEVT